MTRGEKNELMIAFEAVFDEMDQIRSCGKDACIQLIKAMQKYTKEDVGDDRTGTVHVEKMVEEYYRLIIS